MTRPVRNKEQLEATVSCGTPTIGEEFDVSNARQANTVSADRTRRECMNLAQVVTVNS